MNEPKAPETAWFYVREKKKIGPLQEGAPVAFARRLAVFAMAVAAVVLTQSPCQAQRDKARLRLS